MDASTDTELQQLQSLAAAALTEAGRRGASSAEVDVNTDAGLSVTVRCGELITVEHHRDCSLGITVYFGQQKGSASTTDLSECAMAETVAAACRIAQLAMPDDCAGLPEADRLAKEFPDLDLHHPWQLSVEQAAQLARTCEQAGFAVDSRINNSDDATLTSHAGIKVMGNSLGFLHGFPWSYHSLSCALTAEQDGGMQRGYWYTVARDPRDLEDASAVGNKAGERTVRRLGAKRLATTTCPVIFQADVASGLIGHLLSAIRGSALYRKTSFLLGQLGQPVFPAFVQLREEPHLPKALGSALYDNEGVATSAKDLLRDGVLQTYLLGSYSARKLGMHTTGNAGGVHNLILQPGERDLDGLLQLMGRGLLVTDLMGQGVNLTTGDYSRGAAGFWVENGVIQYPVEQITIAGNLKEMFRNVVAIGNDVDYRGNLRNGSILLEHMTVAGE